MKYWRQGHIKAGIDSLRSARLRSFWTMFGVIVGVASVITIVAIGQGIKQQISGQIHQFGKDIITVRPSQLHTNTESGNKSLNLLAGLTITSPLTYKDIDTVNRSKGVVASAPLTVVPGAVTSENGRYTSGFVLGTSSDLASLMNQSLAYGTFLNHDEGGINAAVIGQHAADMMFKDNVPLGSSFTFRGQTFIVKGIFNQFPLTPLSQQADFNNAIFIPNDVASDITKGTATTYTILVRPDRSKPVSYTVNNVKRALDRAHGGQSGFDVLTASQNMATTDEVLNLLTKLIAGTAAISLLVGGIGIMNVMLVSVAERMHEIGIRKAVGATNRQILNQFLIESSLLTLGGGIIGIAIAGLCVLFIRLATNLTPIITWQVVLLATLVSFLVGIVFGTAPALKAARKAPIDALRSE